MTDTKPRQSYYRAVVLPTSLAALFGLALLAIPVIALYEVLFLAVRVPAGGGTTVALNLTVYTLCGLLTLVGAYDIYQRRAKKYRVGAEESVVHRDF